MHYVIGTRGSKLAVAQAETVRTKLAETYPKDTFELRIISTKGDLMSDRPLHEIGGSGVFVREIEQQILSGEIQLGVHSMKDMPADPANGLTFAKAWKREDPRDVLILREKRSLWELPQGAVIGTGSKRRMLQLKKLRPDLIVTGIRGNVETRLLKMDQERLDGIVLAAAGMHRLGMQNRITQYLEADEMVPAPAQGILALEILEKEERLLSMLNALSDPDTVLAAEAERSFLREMGAGCHVPVGAVFRQDTSGNGRLLAMFGDGTKERQAYVSVSGTDPKEMAKQAAAGIRKKLAGTVYLIGAGPGDPGLITAAGLKRLREAGCIVYDRLVPKELLAEAKSGCELIYAGKASRNHTMTQEEIHRLLVKKSMEYPVVVRLKGGDPFVFGRGGEEGLYLRECGVPFTVVPGISSCIAGLAYAGIPVTHRGISRGFHVVTAQDHTGGLAEIAGGPRPPPRVGKDHLGGGAAGEHIDHPVDVDHNRVRGRRHAEPQHLPLQNLHPGRGRRRGRGQLAHVHLPAEGPHPVAHDLGGLLIPDGQLPPDQNRAVRPENPAELLQGLGEAQQLDRPAVVLHGHIGHQGVAAGGLGPVVRDDAGHGNPLLILEGGGAALLGEVLVDRPDAHRPGGLRRLPVSVHGVAGEVEARDLPLLAHPFLLRVLRDVGQDQLRALFRPAGHAEEVHLPLQVLPAAIGDGVHQLLPHRRQAAPEHAEAVEGPRLDQIL